MGEPIETKGMTVRQTDELTAQLRAAIERLLQPGVRAWPASLLRNARRPPSD